MLPTVILRELLADDRAHGRAFTDAWPERVAQATARIYPRDQREEWTMILVEDADRWEAAYERARPADRQVLSLDLLAA